MPVHRGTDLHGSYYQWGNSGKRYYYIPKNNKSRENAKKKAEIQGRAVLASGWKEK